MFGPPIAFIAGLAAIITKKSGKWARIGFDVSIVTLAIWLILFVLNS